jgi:hypothetical protein
MEKLEVFSCAEIVFIAGWIGYKTGKTARTGEV